MLTERKLNSETSAQRLNPLMLSAFAVLLASSAIAQGRDPHLVGPAGVPAARYVALGDQLIDVVGTQDSGSRSRTLGATVDSTTIGSIKFNGWDAGVVPVEFDAGISQERRDQFMQICNGVWGAAAPVKCIPRTSQFGYLRVTQSDDDDRAGSACYSSVAQVRRLVEYRLNLGSRCWTQRTISHELGHALGLLHEHQRPDRDTYLFVDTANIHAEVLGNFTKLALTEPLGDYDFLSVMHYQAGAGAIDTNKPTMIPRAGYSSFAGTMGTATAPSRLDGEALGRLYDNYFRNYTSAAASPTTRFDRADFLDAMERLHAFYYSRLGMNRPAGLSVNGKPDFQGIATWIFDVYLGARSRGFSPEFSFSIVMADLTQSEEWKGKHPGRTSGTRSPFTPAVSFDRSEFLNVLEKLDAFYSAPEGLRRPNGLSIAGGPDFLGIATWVFDIYLSERLRGTSPAAAWTLVVNAISNTDEWRSKH
jgi:hypothetical protein